MKKILVTPRSVTLGGHPALEALREAEYEVVFCHPGRQPKEEELRALLPGCAGYLAGVEPVTAHALETADSLRAISRNGTGIDNVDLAATRARGITVWRAEGANARGVAELAIGQLFALARRSAAADAALKRGAWERPSPGVELEGKTLGLAGCGRVGKLVARIALALGMKVIAHDLFPDADFAPGADFRHASREEVCRESDFLSLHCPPLAGGGPLLDAAALSQLKPGVFIVNTARYDLLEAGAVAEALDSGRIAGLALDVFDREPPVDRRLVLHPSVLATPHLGGYTRESVDRAMVAAVENLLGALRGNS